MNLGMNVQGTRDCVSFLNFLPLVQWPRYLSRYSCRLGRQGITVLIFGRGKRFFFFCTVFMQPLGFTQPPIQWVLGAVPLVVEEPGCEADHSHPSGAKVKKTWICSLHCAICL
jgi:hypothetical protein